MPKKIIIGSSMKFRDKILEVMDKLKKLGFEPLFPNINYTSLNKDVAESLEEKKKLVWDHYI